MFSGHNSLESKDEGRQGKPKIVPVHREQEWRDESHNQNGEENDVKKICARHDLDDPCILITNTSVNTLERRTFFFF